MNATVLRVGQFGASIAIARLVSPREFGVFAVALTVYMIIVNVSEIGVGAAVIREADRAAKIAPTVATIAITTSGILAGLMALSAPYLASGLGSASATSAVRLLALTVVIGGAGTVPAALLTRDYQQKRVFVVDASVFVVSNSVLIIMAVGGYGVMALAWSRVIGQIVSTLLLTVLARERYWPGFDRIEARRLLRFGLPLAGANLIGFTLSNLDFVVVGRVRGARQLGYYNLANNIAGWPVSIFTSILNNVTVTTLSRVRHARAQLEAHLAAAASALAAASFPVSALCVALSQPLIESVYGTRWRAAAPALATLAVFGSIRVIISLQTDLLIAMGKTKRLMLVELVWLLTLAPAMIIGVRWRGILGAGLAHSSVGLLIVVPAFIIAVTYRADLGAEWLARSAGWPLFGSIICGGVAWLVADRISNPILALLLGGSAGAIAYCLILGRWLLSLTRRLRSLYGPDSATTPPGDESPEADEGRTMAEAHTAVIHLLQPQAGRAGLDRTEDR